VIALRVEASFDRAGAHAAVVVSLGLALASCAHDDGGPRLDAVAPASAPHGAMATIAGSRLCGPLGECTNISAAVQLGLEPPMIDAAIISYTPTSATFVVPQAAPAGATSLLVTVGNETSNALAFTVTP
jgi:hypothetical protein